MLIEGRFSAFAVDDHLNQVLADWYGIVMGTSHEEPMMRSIPVEWTLFGVGPWDYATNGPFIYNFWVNSTIRAKPFENIFTVGMRGDSDRKNRSHLRRGTVVLINALPFSSQRRYQYYPARKDHLRSAPNPDRCLRWYQCDDYSSDVVSL